MKNSGSGIDLHCLEIWGGLRLGLLWHGGGSVSCKVLCGLGLGGSIGLLLNPRKSRAFKTDFVARNQLSGSI